MREAFIWIVVPRVGTGTYANPFRADLPPGVTHAAAGPVRGTPSDSPRWLVLARAAPGGLTGEELGSGEAGRVAAAQRASGGGVLLGE